MSARALVILFFYLQNVVAKETGAETVSTVGNQTCKLFPDPSVTYMCQTPGTDGFVPCKQYVQPGVAVKPICNTPNYYTPEVLKYMNCIAGSWDYVAQCKTECGRISPVGPSASHGELPWHAGIYRKSTKKTFRPICGGSLVSNNVVISIGHCFWSKWNKWSASLVAVAVGKTYREWDDARDVDAQKSDVKEINTPKLFLGAATNYQEDLAILILVTPFVYHNYVRPVCLNFDHDFEKRQLVQDKLGKVAGWRLSEENGKASHILKVFEVPYIKIDTCIKTLPKDFRMYLTTDKICAGSVNGTTLCKGDAGGGLAFPSRESGVDRYYLRGVASLGPNTEESIKAECVKYTAFTQISRHENFIREYL